MCQDLCAEQPFARWVIRSDDEKDFETDEPLYWSNTDGWVWRSTADRFSNAERNMSDLPIGGKWEAE